MLSSHGHALRARTRRSVVVALVAVLLSLGVADRVAVGAAYSGPAEAGPQSTVATAPASAVDTHALIRTGACQSGPLDRALGTWWLPAATAHSLHQPLLTSWQLCAQRAVTAVALRAVGTCQERAPPRTAR